MARADLAVPKAPTWTDSYGDSRTTREMKDDHLWNVMAWIRHRRPLSWRSSEFYLAAQRELQRRGIII